MGISNDGAISNLPEAQPVDQHKYLSYIANENFETLDSNVFSIGEVSNLLASSDHRQRLYALDMLANAVKNKDHTETILG